MMVKAGWARIADLFSAALECPADARADFLRASCGEDEALRRELVSLLEADERAGDFLSVPAHAGCDPHVLEGRRIGPYRIVAEVGHGGMGVVVRAVRDDDVFEKTVALKLVHGAAGPEALRRFAIERQILARLAHPNIASILDGGSSAEGQPYLVMEYVEGETIDRYCAMHALGKRERLALFLTICGAVHYAHQHLVIHRDLKPQNILVDARGQPKLLDFGIAKLVAPDTGLDDASTASLVLAMTPAYASPEQLRGNAVTIASDIYALGVLLHELMTGRRPYEDATSVVAALDAICSREPQPPSCLVRTAMGTVRPPVSSAELRGDLDTIVLKALRKEPERRYQSVLELADDVRRHLDGHPVLARGDGVGYHLSKFVGRHRLALAAAAVVLASLFGGLATTVWQWRRAEANRLRAERRFADLREVATSFLFDFHDAIATLPGATTARELVVERATRYLDSVAADAELDVALQRELAMAYTRLGDIQGGPGRGNLGKLKAAMASYDKALALRRALAISVGEEADITGLANLEMKVSRVLSVTGEWERAEATARIAQARIEPLAAVTTSDLRKALAALFSQISYIEARRGNDAGALADLRRAVADGRAFSDAHPGDAAAHVNLARDETSLVEQLVRHGDVAEAVVLADAPTARLDALVAAAPDNADYRRDLIYTLNIVPFAMEARGDLAAAARTRRRALSLARALVAADPANQGDRTSLAYVLQFLGATLVRGGEPAEGIADLVEAVEHARAFVGADRTIAYARDRLAQVLAQLAFALEGLGTRPGEMCAALRESVALWAELDSKGQLSGEVRQDFDKAKRLVVGCPPRGDLARPLPAHVRQSP